MNFVASVLPGRPLAARSPLRPALLRSLPSPPAARAETGYDAWLRYAPIDDRAARERYDDAARRRRRPRRIADHRRGPRGADPRHSRHARPHPARASELPAEGAIVLGTYDDVHRAHCPRSANCPSCRPTATGSDRSRSTARTHLVIAAPNDRGVLYGTFALLRMIGLEAPIADLNVRDKPYAPIRILNHWDNLDGTIERGYAGRSIFWENGHVTKDLGRVRDYARLMASVGINGCSINNVNADTA